MNKAPRHRIKFVRIQNFGRTVREPEGELFLGISGCEALIIALFFDVQMAESIGLKVANRS
jgi:hypothetical protein